MKRYFIPVFLLFTFISLSVSAQTFSVSASIKTSSGESAASASVILKGTTYKTISDSLGNYQLTNIKAGVYLLQVSVVGYELASREIDVSDNLSVNVLMSKKTQQLQDVN